MPNYVYYSPYELCHYGVKGMKWGVRRYQNEDGTLTDAGQKRLVKSIKKAAKSRSARKNMHEKTSDMLKEELERAASFKKTANSLRERTANFENLLDNAYNIKDTKKQDKAYEKVDKAWDDYVTERNKMVDSLLGKYANTQIKAVHLNTTQISEAKLIARDALDKLAGWRFMGVS